jgi:transcriptional regulator with XRE-family HTH domain
MGRNRTPIKRAIFESDLTQRELAAQVGLSESRMSLIANGLRVSDELSDKLATALGRSAAELWPPLPEERAA